MKKCSLILLVLCPFVLLAQAESVSNPSFFPFSRKPFALLEAQGFSVLKEAAATEAVFSCPFAENEAFLGRCAALFLAGFRQLETEVSFARKYARRFSFALTASYRMLGFSDAYYGTKHGVDFSLASCFRPDESCFLSVQWKNPFALPYIVEGERRERIPSALHFSTLYRCAQNVLVYAEYIQDFYSISHLSLGVDVHLQYKLRMYAALRFPDVQCVCGIGCMGKKSQYVFYCSYSRPMGSSMGLMFVKNGIFSMEGLGLYE